MNSFLRSSAALGISAVLCSSGCSGGYFTTQIFTDETTGATAPTWVGQSSPMAAYRNYSCSATNCSLATVASSPTYPPMMLAVAKTTTIISLSDDPVADGVAMGSAAKAIKSDDSGEEVAKQ
ncbi:MAG: hypothetical protein ABSG12_13880 [Steroidobacteraceae bacterium]|jgi:hypothetical protein